MRMPFARPLNVGGNRENMEKNAAWPPEDDPPLRVTTNLLLTSDAVFDGWSVVVNSFHCVVCAPDTEIELDASVVPSLATSEAVNRPLNVDPAGNL